MATKIMLIRHAEKPSGVPPIGGVNEDGSAEPQALSVQGWQRAGALIGLFAPRNGSLADARLARPDAIFASGIAPSSGSLRPQQTVLPLAKVLARAVNVSRSKGEERELANDLQQASGAVLVSWQHEGIPPIANEILGNSQTCPQAWPIDRFDMVWVVDSAINGKWSFAQVPQMLLAGDKPDPI